MENWKTILKEEGKAAGEERPAGTGPESGEGRISRERKKFPENKKTGEK